MNDTPWTPGPWQVFASPWNPDKTTPAFIGRDLSTPVAFAAMTEADTRLIVAAPEMAELLRLAANPRGQKGLDELYRTSPYFRAFADEARRLLRSIEVSADV